jgi:hypothetical protein
MFKMKKDLQRPHTVPGRSIFCLCTNLKQNMGWLSGAVDIVAGLENYARNCW